MQAVNITGASCKLLVLGGIPTPDFAWPQTTQSDSSGSLADHHKCLELEIVVYQLPCPPSFTKIREILKDSAEPLKNEQLQTRRCVYVSSKNSY